jgi:hypothetical protein
VENQTFFTKSKILEKAVNQVQGDALSNDIAQQQIVWCILMHPLRLSLNNFRQSLLNG